MNRRTALTPEAKYEMLRDFSYRIRNTFDLDGILEHLLDTVLTMVRYDAAGIFVLKTDIAGSPYVREEGMIAGIARRGYDARPVSRDPMLALGKGIVGHVIRTGESLVIPDVRKDPRYVAGRTRTVSEIAVPILRDDRPVGALNLESDTVSAFDETDLEVLRVVADAAAIAIEKAILHYQIVENRRIEDQLQIAEEVQKRMLPSAPPVFEGYDIAGLCLPTHEVGGDYFDYVHLGEAKLGIMIADVSGNGIPAALVMTSFRALFLPSARSGMAPSQLMGQIGTLLPEFARRRDFITAFYGILDARSHTFHYSNAGHNPPMLIRTDGTIRRLAEGGPSLGIMPGQGYESGTVEIGAGETMVLFTDGVVEVFDRERQEFGDERLAGTVVRASAWAADVIVKRIAQVTGSFHGSDRFEDDFTVVVVKRSHH